MIHTSHAGRANRKVQITPNNLIKNQNTNNNGNVRTNATATATSPSSATDKPFLKADQNTIASNNNKSDYENKVVTVGDANPYIANTINSYVKTQNYY